ncbi:exodeoxyribonuclease VII small subunit [Campylobacter lari]|uniref:Exodeoxyribonuclease VII small subunit n=2 Tax=Campylobacter TaxID=194 RepID=A0A4R5T7T6_CAMLA|nr:MULTISPECIES: exodeoxyribonuclease VII small subunit [Campylobacter]MCR8678085.1 exodeoxyribonuclease VII small subunit [Campylobacter sp. S4:11]MCR8683373.1 exodeoxyribonuclease VII small subunit [Campylobacter sp. LMG 17559]MCR8705667.1 exodeoxyribonuclease VII small subunit [Campylobacter sp. 2352 PW]MCR8706714.1 exodeoxyribonuclease VII small subunit [Campylobacter sp. W0066.2]MCR8708794.1 exodeoxyribonuclease VII small subunit [Campylobacter sp. RM5063]MCR8711595.1 exodeoxyribonucleas
MEFEDHIKQAELSLEKLNDKDLDLKTCVEIYKEGLKSIKQARTMLENAKLEIEQVDE